MKSKTAGKRILETARMAPQRHVTLGVWVVLAFVIGFELSSLLHRIDTSTHQISECEESR